MTGHLIVIALLVLGSALILVFAGVRRSDRAWLPDELRTARLRFNEHTMFINGDLPVVGRLDRAYQRPDGVHVLVELKTRDRFQVYDTDVAELSLQAWLLRSQAIPTASHAYVMVLQRTSGERRAIRVDLRDDAFCEGLVERYVALRGGFAQPTAQRGPKCKSCGHRPRCYS
jgi:hypothetical protein